MIIMWIFPAILILAGCNGLMNADKVKAFIPGTYYASWKTSFSIAVDTMLITPLSDNGSEGYLITKRTHYQFLHGVPKRAPEYRITKWVGEFNAAQKTIVVPVNGRILTFVNHRG